MDVLDRGAPQSTHLQEVPIHCTTYSGIDAIGRILKKARKSGMQAFGHSYKTSVDENLEPAHV